LGTQVSFAFFTVKTKAIIVKIYDVIQHSLFFQNIISFCLNSIVKWFNIIEKLGMFLCGLWG